LSDIGLPDGNSYQVIAQAKELVSQIRIVSNANFDAVLQGRPLCK